MNKVYFPLIKTRNSELRCFEHLSESTKSKLCPVYELTKARRSKKAPDGDIIRKVEKILTNQNGAPYILDVTTSPLYSNIQTESLLRSDEGFSEWYSFLDLHCGDNVIPMIHLYEDSYDDDPLMNVELFLDRASRKWSSLALRLPLDLDLDEYRYYLERITSALRNDCDLYVIIDSVNLRARYEKDRKNLYDDYLCAINVIKTFSNYIKTIVFMGTSFPLNPRVTGGSDDCGQFKVYEYPFYEQLRSEADDLSYGDYVSINAEQIELMARSFVPRIDVYTGSEFFYKRYRDRDGGYQRCAAEVLDDSRYENLGTWADEMIRIKAGRLEGESGKNPSYWISIRMVYYIEQILRCLGA
jgi:hypothetical protein